MLRRLRVIAMPGVCALAVFFALLPVALAAPSAATKTVTLMDNVFDPKTITVNVGDTVMWMDKGQNEHTVTADNNSFDSGDLKAGEKTSFSFTFTKAGTFPFHCKYHGGVGGVGMSGMIVVQATGASSAPAKLPRTGGEDAPIGLLLGALALLITGIILTVRGTQRRV